MKFDNASFDPFVSISAEPPKVRQAQSVSRVSQTPKPHTVDTRPSEFDQIIELLQNDITHFVNEGLYLRRDMEGLLAWESYMGRHTPNSKTWGDVQSHYSENRRAYLHARAVQLVSDIEADSRSVVRILDRYIFKVENWNASRSEIMQQARQELFGQ